jgi:hypothetical protein
MSGLGRGLDRSWRVVGVDGDVTRDWSAPFPVPQQPGRSLSRTQRAGPRAPVHEDLIDDRSRGC